MSTQRDAMQDMPAAPALPDGWARLRMERVPGHPETVAYGPAEDMERLRVTLDAYYTQLRAAQHRASLPVVEAGALGAVQAPAPAHAKTIKLGSYGQAFDAPADRRAYTYKHQPGNQAAWRIGEASSRVEAGGDLIDRGLSLLKVLEAGGFGVFELDEAAAVEAPAVAHPDDAAVDALAAAMKAKLADARAKGRSGWQACPPEGLSLMLREHVEKGDPRDVANFCAFLWALGQGIALPPVGTDNFDLWVSRGMGAKRAAAPDDAELERLFCERVGIDAINPEAVDTRRSCLWFAKGYRAAISMPPVQPMGDGNG